MWYSDKAAFRAGYVPSSEWDKVNTGNYSMAFGYGTIANNVGTTAFGFQTTASGVFATAMGYQTVSKALGGFAIGHNNDITDNPDPNNPLPADRIFQIGNGDFSGGKSNALTVLRNGNVGIGTLSPTQKLQIGADGVLRVEGPSLPNGSIPAMSVGGYGDFQVDAFGSVGGRFIVKESGKVGIGLSNPIYPLNFPASFGDKISLFGNGSIYYGFGVQNNLLQIHTEASSSDIAFGYGSSSSFTERFRMKGSGAFVVNGNGGATGQVLQSNGGTNPPTWVTPYSLYDNTVQVAPGGASTLINTENVWVPLTGMTYTFSSSLNTKVLVMFNVQAHATFCTACGATSSHVGVYVDNGLTLHIVTDVANFADASQSGSYLAQLGPGSHTIDIRGMITGPAAIYNSNNIIVQIIKQ